jgi:hypothetical protein
MSETDVLLTPPEAAELLRTTPKCLGVIRCRGGGPPFVKIGRRVCYRRSTLNDFIAANEGNSTRRARV